MASTGPALGNYVQYNSTVDNPNAAQPSGAEQTVGIIRQMYQGSGGPYYQVVWNPGDLYPKVGWYHGNELTVITQQAYSTALQQLQAGTYQPPQQTQGSNYQQPNLPTAALPPMLQGTGNYAAGTASQTNPSLNQQS